MANSIAIFNHKGGVGKTTTALHLGWILAERGHKVMLVDTDPQCNLSGLVLESSFRGGLDQFYKLHPTRNLHAALEPAFLSRPQMLQHVACVPVAGCPNLLLLPGHVRLAEYEVALGVAQSLAGPIPALAAIPGALSHLVRICADAIDADYVLMDMSPSLGSLNQNFLMTSDFFMIPSAPDYFSVMAVQSLAEVLPRWAEWARGAHALPAFRDAHYPFPAPHLKFLGTLVQRFRPRKGKATVKFQKWIDSLNAAVVSELAPKLSKHNLMLKPRVYDGAGLREASYCLGEVSDFNTLVAASQEHCTPVFALTDAMLGYTGTVLRQQRKPVARFREVFTGLADRVEGLVG